MADVLSGLNELPSEEEALEDVRADEHEARLNERTGDLPAFERRMKAVKDKQDRERGDDKRRSR